MSDITTLLERNRVYAEDYHGKLPIMPRFSTVILTCIDSRIDPAHFLGLQEGDALVMRSAGGRITQDIEMDLGILSLLGTQMGGDDFKGLSLAIVQHTDCGYERLVMPPLRTAINQKVGIDMATLDEMAVHNHHQSIEDGIHRLKNSSFVPQNLMVSGYIFDVENGIMREVISAQSISD